jgi:peptide/nickel transport system substrate-binding protein
MSNYLFRGKTVFFSIVFLVLASGIWAEPKTDRLVVCDDVADPATLDPQKQFSEKNHTVVQQIYEGLVRFDTEGKIEPALAVSWKRIDPLKMRFILRNGVVFHSGEPFTAEAVRYSVNRYLDPHTGFPAVGFINSLDRVDIIDDHTVDVVTKFPDGLLLNRLAGFILIVPPEKIGEGEMQHFDEKPNGTGPFMFSSWERGEQIILKANPDYWMPGFPSFNELVFRFVPSDRQMDLLFRGEIDVMTELPGTMTTRIMSQGRARVVKKNSFWTVGSTLNINRYPLSNVTFRKALNLAINREEIVRYDSFGNGEILATMSMPGEGGHNPRLNPYSFDVEQAKRYLSGIGISTPTVLKTLVRVHGLRSAKIIQAQLKRINVNLDIRKVETDADVIRAIQSEDWDLAIAGLPDPMCHAFFAQSIFLFSMSPFSLTKDKEIDDKLQAVAMTLDDGEREKRAQDLDLYIYQNALGLFTYQRIKTYAVNRQVIFEPSVSGMPHFFRVRFRK